MKLRLTTNGCSGCWRRSVATTSMSSAAGCYRRPPGRQRVTLAAGGSDEAAVELGARWFYSRRFSPLPVQLWGTTANLAFRKQVLADVQVGGFDSALGPGVPSGDGEAAYFFYRVLRHGYRLRYQPEAVTWYQHAGTRAELMRRHFESGKGYVAGHLHMLLKDGDFRAWGRLCALPRVHASRLVSSIAVARPCACRRRRSWRSSPAICWAPTRSGNPTVS